MPFTARPGWPRGDARRAIFPAGIVHGPPTDPGKFPGMPSDHPVLVRQIDSVEPHPNADKLDIYRVAGWQCISSKLDDGSPRYRVGDKVVFFPPDTVLPDNLARQLGVEKYLKNRRDENNRPVGVVGQIRLRGEMTFGVLTRASDHLWDFVLLSELPVGTDVSEFFGARKYVRPPAQLGGGPNKLSGPRLSEHAGFPKYTDVNNWRNYPDLIEPGEEVVVTEKLHGTNSRVGLVDGQWMAGSHRVRRKPPRGWKPKVPYKVPLRTRIANAFRTIVRKIVRKPEPPIDASDATYWAPLEVPGVQDLILSIRKATGASSVILYGEIVGSEVQPLHYGYGPASPNGRFGYYLFDIKVDGKYWPWNLVELYARAACVSLVPELYRGPYSAKTVWQYASGNTTVIPDGRPTHIREGVVVKPVFDRTDARRGRVIQKLINDDYLVLTGKEPKYDAVRDE